jgi:2-phospho-L-lactate guanylyltransferase
MTEAILIPVKLLDTAKLRLAGALDPPSRKRLALAMLADVLGATAGWPLRLMVTSDRAAADMAGRAGWRVIADPGWGLNGAVEAGTDCAAALGADALLVLPFDIPLVTPEELRTVFAADAEVTIARSDDGGTTGLLRRPPAAIDCAFGPGSAAAHSQAARLAGLRTRSVDLPGLSLDVDDLGDLRRLARTSTSNPSAQVARELLAAAGLGTSP